MPTHAHGQGYTDINFLIPELVREVRYRKGTYYAEQGNFSAAGSVDLDYRSTLSEPLASLTIGEDSYQRGLLAGSAPLGAGSLLLGLDYSTTDGPWELSQDYRKLNGLAKYTRGDAERGYGLTLMGYDGEWRSTDQIPMRAVRSGRISRFGFVDASDGGQSYRYSLSVDAWSQDDDRPRAPMRSTTAWICSRTSPTRSTPITAISSSSTIQDACTARVHSTTDTPR
jgi:hypothetical protein